MGKYFDARALAFLAGGLKASLIIIAMAAGAALAGGPAAAQTIVSSINGDPITNIDIDERMKLLRVLRKPATREAAIESLYADRLELREGEKYGVHLKDADITEEIVRVAKDLKLQPQVLVAEIQHAGVSEDHFKTHFRADYSFNLLVQALNKGVEASEDQIRAELAKQGGKAASGLEYTIRQVIFAVPNSATVASLNERGHEAEQLRTRFVDCDSGVPLARAISDVTVRDPMTKTSIELNEGLRQLLDKTPAGHLTPPQRSSSGIEMIALCGKGPPKDDTAARTAISQRLLAVHIDADAERRLKEMRARAVIVKN
jgi:peptidyl-prolyl cis-trans isomerase SurA